MALILQQLLHMARPSGLARLVVHGHVLSVIQDLVTKQLKVSWPGRDGEQVFLLLSLLLV
jgi:hypothetical protein